MIIQAFLDNPDLIVDEKDKEILYACLECIKGTDWELILRPDVEIHFSKRKYQPLADQIEKNIEKIHKAFMEFEWK